MSRYDPVRYEMGAFIEKVRDVDAELYGMAIAARLILPQDGTSDKDATQLLNVCIEMYAEILARLDSTSTEFKQAAQVRLRLNIAYMHINGFGVIYNEED